MELPASNYLHEESHALDKNKIVEILQRYGLQYQVGALVTDLTGTMVSKTLDSFIKEQDIPALELEFNRAIKNIDENPREAISAASNILETICKVYIDEQNLEKPAKQDLKSIWSIVRKDLGFKPERLEDKDLQTILTGLFAVIEGIGALRTHASSAHGAGVKPYNVQPRHSRLAVLSAHTAAVFILETWKYKTSTNHRAQ